MISLFKKKVKKEIDTTGINSLKKALKVIEEFMYFEEFDKADKALEEIQYKENESFNYYIETLKESDKKKEIEKFKGRIDSIQKLKKVNTEKKVKFQRKMAILRKKNEVLAIEKQITEHLSNGKFNESNAILNEFAEKYAGDIQVINFVNSLKKKITKIIERNKIKKENEIKNDAFREARLLMGELKSEMAILKPIESRKTTLLTLKDYFSVYTKIKNRLRDKRLLDEINVLIQAQGEKNELAAKAKLSQIHNGLIKEIKREKISGYDVYGKTLGADNISGDILGIHHSKKYDTLFIGDATGHGTKAGFIITQFTKKFNELVDKKDFGTLAMEINNALKQDLKSGNFVTSVLFQIDKGHFNNLKIIGMGHEPLFIYRKKSNTVEKISAGGLATGIRLIRDLLSIKQKVITMENGDIVLTYTDGIVEAKNENNEMFTIDRIQKRFAEYAKIPKITVEQIYEKIMDDLKKHTGGRMNFSDDVTIMIIKRDVNKEIIDNETAIIEMLEKEGVEKKHKNKLIKKSVEEIREEIAIIQKQSSTQTIIKNLEALYKTGEIPRLKQDCIRYIKEGFIHKKINYFLKKALDSENDFKIKQKNKKIADKYNVMAELYKKGDYNTVIIECGSIITKDGNI